MLLTPYFHLNKINFFQIMLSFQCIRHSDPPQSSRFTNTVSLKNIYPKRNNQQNWICCKPYTVHCTMQMVHCKT